MNQKQSYPPQEQSGTARVNGDIEEVVNNSPLDWLRLTQERRARDAVQICYALGAEGLKTADVTSLGQGDNVSRS